MALFFRKKKSTTTSTDSDTVSAEANNIESSTAAATSKTTTTETKVAPAKTKTSKESTAADSTLKQESDPQERLSKGLSKSSNSLLGKLSHVFSSGIEFNDDIFEELEDSLISCDIGVDASMSMIDALRTTTKTQKLKSKQQVIECLQEQAIAELTIAEQPWAFNSKPYVLMMVGVNGVGKTTTVAKIARHFQKQGKKVMLAAADTFRAAATEQLIEWGKRLDIPVIHQEQGADAAAVAHDALNSALARNIDILIIDTAGRLHTQTDLMDQLAKVTRILKKIDPDTPHEVMQILDATTGQNAQTQLNHFKKIMGVNSICLTKLDGSAKGGVAISLAKAHQLPIRFIGVGEGFDDLKTFSAEHFAKAFISDVEK